MRIAGVARHIQLTFATTLEVIMQHRWMNALQDVEEIMIVKAFCTKVNITGVTSLMNSALPQKRQIITLQ